ncbi:MAG: HlyD family efflux transporter periplasmic adaptor subunit, partial [Chloroflexota bacterium]|nr:HlyD family efflux transporter periplasmic adaptor subunit [Chloroflexota bacterium]
PFTCTIATKAATEGEMITSGQPMITLVDLTGFRIEVEVDEIDIGQVRVGDPVTILIDSLPDTEIVSEIDYVAPVPTISQGVVTYPVRILLDAEAAPGVRVGMTTNVNITTETREGALLVPNRAIEIDRNSGKLFVEKIDGDEVVRTEVQVGLRNDEVSEITDGISEGDVLLIRSVDSRERLRQELTE